MRKVFKRVLLGLLVAALAVAGLIGWALYPKISNLNNEYITAQVIGDLDQYVAAHPGAWPKNWKELGKGLDRSQYTRFRFDLTVEQILAQPELIYDAAQPVTGRYLTYPHAREQLDEVVRKLKENAEKTKLNLLLEPTRAALKSTSLTGMSSPAVSVDAPMGAFVPSLRSRWRAAADLRAFNTGSSSPLPALMTPAA